MMRLRNTCRSAKLPLSWLCATQVDHVYLDVADVIVDTDILPIHRVMDRLKERWLEGNRQQMATADCCRIPVFQTLFHVFFHCFYLICPGFYRDSGVLLLFWNHADGHWRTRRHSQWWRTCPHQGEASEDIFGSRRFFSAVAMTTCKSFDDLQIQQLSIVLELKVILDIFSTIQIYSTI